MIPVYGVRRFCQHRADGRCFELFVIATGQCASFPLTKVRGELHCQELNQAVEQDAMTLTQQEAP